MTSKNSAENPGKFKKWLIRNRLLLVFLLVLSGAFFFYQTQPSAGKITWEQLKEMITTNDVERITVINREKAEIYIRKDSLQKEKHRLLPRGITGAVNNGPHYYIPIGSVDVFEKQLENVQKNASRKIPVEYINNERSWFSILLDFLVPLVLLAMFWFFIAGRLSGPQGRRIFDFGKSSPGIYNKGKTVSVTFSDVAGYEEAKKEVMEVVEFLRQPGDFTRLGAKIPKGILLVGAPGTGKTLMAKAVAGEAAVPFFSLSGSEFIEMFVGVGAARVRDLFSKAKEHAPSIIFIDEIDTIGRTRGKALSLQANDERESTLNQLLAELDGFESNDGIIVMAATNRADILDPALLRPGRFDRHIHLDLPDKEERQAIFGVHLKQLLLSPSVDASYLASQTPGFSGADIANICNEAALIAARKKRTAVESQDFFDAIDRVVAGLEKKSKIISPAEKKIIAFHEAGHAVVSWMLGHVDPLQKISIIPRGKSLGSSWYLPEEHKIITYTQFFERLCATLGGRAAEKLVFDEVSSGALDDLEKVTKQAYTMVAHLGLNEKIGNVSFFDSTGAADASFQRPYSEDTAKMIDEEVRKIIEHAFKTSLNILEKNRASLDRLAALLQQKEIVYKKDIEPVLGPRPLAGDAHHIK